MDWMDIVNEKVITEIAWPKAIAFHELCLFYRMATEEQQEQMEKILEDEDFESFKGLIFKVVGTKLGDI